LKQEEWAKGVEERADLFCRRYNGRSITSRQQSSVSRGGKSSEGIDERIKQSTRWLDTINKLYYLFHSVIETMCVCRM